MFDAIGANAKGHQFYLIALISAGILLIILNKRRVKFVIPALLMGVIIANPWFKDIWEKKLHLQYYWRILWIVPVIPLCAALPAALAEKVSNKYLKSIIVIVCVAVYAATGSWMYSQPYSKFVFPATNSAKLPQDTVDVAEWILERDEQPRVIADRKISIYLRQYDGQIETLFARDVDGYIWGPSAVAWEVNNQINNPNGDMSIVAAAMKNEGYEYLVINDTDETRRRQLKENGLERQGNIRQWAIYTYLKLDHE